MLTIQVIASGSRGNCYTVEDGKGGIIMLDCGISEKAISRAIGFKRPHAIFITHEHQDHAKAVKDFLKRGVDCFMTRGTAEALGIAGHYRVNIMDPLTDAQAVNLTFVYAIPTQHDAREPCGFLLDDGEDRILYATDTYYMRYKIPGVTKYLIECNHSYKILRENVEAGILQEALAQRLVKSHFSLENLLEFFRANDLSKVKEIWLCHLSSRNANPQQFERAVEAATGKPTYIAAGGRKSGKL